MRALTSICSRTCVVFSLLGFKGDPIRTRHIVFVSSRGSPRNLLCLFFQGRKKTTQKEDQLFAAGSQPEGPWLRAASQWRSSAFGAEAKVTDRLRRRVPDVGRCHFELTQLHEDGLAHLKAGPYGVWVTAGNEVGNPGVQNLSNLLVR